MFQSGKLYVHRGMLDVCVKCSRRVWADATRLKVKISWYLRRPQLTPMVFSETVTIQRKDLANWREFKEGDDYR